MIKRWRSRTPFTRLDYLLGVSLTLIMLTLAWLDLPALTRLENLSLDVRFRIRGERPVGTEVVLVVIDEKSLRELGRWPWPRHTQARLIDRLSANGAKVIGLDLIYAEPERRDVSGDIREMVALMKATPPGSSTQMEAWLQHLASTDSDSIFAKSLMNAHNVVLGFPFFVQARMLSHQPVQSNRTDARSIRRSEFMVVRQPNKGELVEPYHATDLLPPLDNFASVALSLGHVYSIPDIDGTTRAEYLALRFEDSYYPSLALELSRLFLELPKDRLALTIGDGVALGDELITTDQKARMFINFAGREGHFQSMSATDVINQRVASDTFKDKIVLVGTSALGTYDQHVTPFSANYPGVEKNATVVENILHQRFIRKSLWFAPIELGTILICGLTITFSLHRMRALLGTALVLIAGLCYAAFAQYIFVTDQLWLPLLTPLLTIAGTLTTVTLVNFVTKESQAKEIRQMFSSYVSPQIVEQLIASPSKAALGGERKELTMLFADIVDFASFNETHSAEDVVAQLNEYLTAMTEVIFRWDGTLDKFVGDAIVVFWGAPLDQPDHAERAIKCALHMRKRLDELRAKWGNTGKTLLDNGIGINTGTAVVGNIGAEGMKVDYTMIGDQVNVASRVQGLTRTFGVSIVVTESTARCLKEMMNVEERMDNRGRLGHVLLRQLGTVNVKGKQVAVGAYAIEPLKMGEASRVEELPLRLSVQHGHGEPGR